MKRFRASMTQLGKFALVGGIGVIVNQTIFVLANIVGRDLLGVRDRGVLFPIPFTEFNIRNYHLYMLLGFLVANLGNFLLNRAWTFKSDKHASFWREYLPFLAVGLAAQVVGFLLMTLLMNPTSPLCLPDAIFDDSSGLRTKSYWANLIVIVCVTPVNFLLNKVWTFRAIRSKGDNPEEAVDSPLE